MDTSENAVDTEECVSRFVITGVKAAVIQDIVIKLIISSMREKAKKRFILLFPVF